VMLRDDIRAGKPKATREREAAPDTSLAPEAAALFAALRLWRSAEAKAQAVPPYLIFSDAVLRDIAASRPRNEDELAVIKGVGASKLARYGCRVLSVVRNSQVG
jgi:ATP-dependent DNA helicase RecQ